TPDPARRPCRSRTGHRDCHPASRACLSAPPPRSASCSRSLSDAVGVLLRAAGEFDADLTLIGFEPHLGCRVLAPYRFEGLHRAQRAVPDELPCGGIEIHGATRTGLATVERPRVPSGVLGAQLPECDDAGSVLGPRLAFDAGVRVGLGCPLVDVHTRSHPHWP